ncbi:MAG: hypothetical protein R6W72_13030 [Desulfurivibrionaceae bacterium]
MDLDERAVRIVEEAEALNETDLRGALVKMREALALEPDYPSLEDEIFIREDAIAKLDGVLEYIVVLLREGKDYQACEMLEGLPDNYIIQDKSGLVSGLVEKIEKAKSLIGRAREQARKDPLQALPIFEEAFTLVSDYPGLLDELNALKRDNSQYDSSVEAIEEALRNKKVKQATGLFDSFRQTFPDDEKVGRFKADIVNLSKSLAKKKERKVNFLRIAVSVGTVLAVAGAYVAFEMSMMKKAGRKALELDRLLAAGKFAEGRSLGLEIKQDLGKVRAFSLGGKELLLTKVDDILQSESLIMGAEGKVLFDGKYIPADQLSGSSIFQDNLEQGKALAGAGKCDEAMTKVEAALAVAETKKTTTSPGLAEVRGAIDDCRLNSIKELISQAEALRSAGSNGAALNVIEAALAKAAEYTIDPDGDAIAEALSLRGRINRASLKEMVAAGDKLSDQDSFAMAAEAYREAAAFAGANGLANDPLTRQLPELIDKSRVEILLASADRDFAAGNWQEAALSYEKGMALARSAGLQGLPSLERASGKLAQSRKMVTVVELRRYNESALKNSRSGKNIQARGIYAEAIGQAEENKWRDSNEVAAVLGELKEGLAGVEESLFVEDKKQVLLERFAAIIKKDFALDKNATLLDPQVVLMNNTPELLEFSLSAKAYSQQGSQGKYTRYQVVYGFNRETMKWVMIDRIAGE